MQLNSSHVRRHTYLVANFDASGGSRALDAAGNDAAADATIDLGACLRNPKLRRVDLSGNGFDDGQRARLAAAFGCAPGRVLLLS